MSVTDSDLTIGVLALQGAIEEHVDCIKRLGSKVRVIRLPKDIDGIDGIIMPGGESTAMAIIGNEFGLFPALKEWVKSNRPIWGTCAGMILLSDYAIMQKEGGQSLVGGLDVHVCRNFFGPQLNSCSMQIPMPKVLCDDNQLPFPGIFIRAPAILKLGPQVTELCRISATPHRSAREEVSRLLATEGIESSGDNTKVDVIVAAQQQNILVTAFHPELTDDLRWHRYFLSLVKEYKQQHLSSSEFMKLTI